MAKHIPSEHYLGRPHELTPKVTIYREIEHRSNDTENYLLPAVFTVEKGMEVTFKYPGPGVLYFTHGKAQYEDTAQPGTPTAINTGAIVHVEKGSVLRWSSSSGAKGFGVFYVPPSIKGFDAFVVSK